MKKSTAMLLAGVTAAVFLVQGCATMPTAEEMAQKERLCVLDFKDDPALPGWGPAAAERLSGTLRSAWLWRVTPRTALAEALTQARLPLRIDRFGDRESVYRIGEDLGIRYVVYGSLESYQSQSWIQNTKKTMSVGTGQFDTKRVRKYVVAGPKVDKQVEVTKEVEVDTAVGMTRASLRFSAGVIDTQGRRVLTEYTFEESGIFEDADEKQVIESLIQNAANRLLKNLRDVTHKSDGRILL